MTHVAGLPVQHDVRVARDREATALHGFVGQRDDPDLEVVVRWYCHARMHSDPVVVSPVLDLLGRELDRHPVVTGRGRRGGPQVARVDIAHVDPRPAVVQRGIGAPPGEGGTLPVARSAAPAGKPDRIRFIRQDVGLGKWGHGRHAPRLHGARPRNFERGRVLARSPCLANGHAPRDPFVQQVLDGGHARVGTETFRRVGVRQSIADRDHDHALVMRHVRAHAPGTGEVQPGRRPVVQGFVETHRTEHAQPHEPTEVPEYLRVGDRQRQKRGVRRDHEAPARVAPQSQLRHAEGPVLVTGVAAQLMIARF